ncbi:hypothetical protein BU17DRAFT_79848 [Hysterangium stoloniferum]|nr:hypothetical protein BU17DRAFT_79848 [Hysterangium stoloniferum]
MAAEDLRTLKVVNDPDNAAHREGAGQKKKRKRTPHGKKADKVDNASTQQEGGPSPTMKFDSVADDGASPRKGKKAKRSRKSTDTVEVEDVTLDATSKKQKKQKGAIESEIEVGDPTSALDAVQDSPPKKKHKHKQDTETIVPEDSPAHGSPQRAEGTFKRKRTHVATPREADVDLEAADRKENPKRKKKKHSKSESADESTENPPTPKIKKKKQPKTDDFPNPSGDPHLSESALKALEYVHANVTSAPDWKFNKARQNWIIRNVWDDAIDNSRPAMTIQVPDLYFPSCIKYLSGVQGNTRDVLIKSSKDIIEKASVQATAAAKAASLVKATTKVKFLDDGETEVAKGRLENSGSGDVLGATAEAGVEKPSDELISPGKIQRARNVLQGLEVGTT